MNAKPSPLAGPDLRSVARSLAQLAAAATTCLALLAPCAPAMAGPIGSGPVLLLGYSPDSDASNAPQDLGIVNLGWRWTFDGADVIDDFLAKGGIDFSWSVEPLAGVVFGDAEAFEASVVPAFRLAPAGWDNVVPWFEAGIGLAYTGLRNYGMGSSVNFSDNVGVGVTFGQGEGLRWSVGYRFRHLSHAGILSEHNEGLNAHFLTLSVE